MNCNLNYNCKLIESLNDILRIKNEEISKLKKAHFVTQMHKIRFKSHPLVLQNVILN